MDNKDFIPESWNKMVITPIKGCVIFVRSLISQHMKESFEIASSSVGEDGAVFGALDRIELAVDELSLS
ncbi:hypothetical protein [Raoultella terrigena]|uniref:hypothetical protein n=1 Tax=Raoultella terrigena TaxID=577 RepID=UPI001F378C56